MKLSSRLSAIDSLIYAPYDVIWDCCCDHGLLGMALLKRAAAKQINFVDIVPTLMDELEHTLTRFSDQQAACQWQVLCQDVATIELQPSAKQLIIIAGVGGELLLRLVQKMVANCPEKLREQLSFIVCPVHHTYALRQGLQALGLGLIKEQLVQENNRFYEVIQLSFTSNTALSVTGSQIWNNAEPMHELYLQQLVAHYTRMLNKDRTYFQYVLDDYQKILLN
ncbi:tRNA (adenine(22)-N(1))-methyltransferase [Pseudoalteromonas ostreae]|uniref:tRNA (adenine(22)-N(1))-methyltransferase n=1 Tax=Pseudoalteromonas ostreae TaxID=2774154 RepID=UPI001B37F8A7|nr:tRNA (adenine(22)-N(1))-methyltransferase TrmK [Pseudoalteromonas ostreae]